MPDGIKTTTKHTAYAWAGNPLVVWGNVTWGTATAGSYTWDFGDGTATASGPVSNARDIAVTHTYAIAGTYYATLRVVATDSSQSFAQVRIDVLPVNDGQAAINLAIERGLKRLYLNQNSDGSWISQRAATALSVLAFENRGHLPLSPTTDIYLDSVKRGLRSLFATLIYNTSFGYPAGYNPDVNGDGILLGHYGGGENFYPHGMSMMAIAATGPYDPNYPKTDVAHNPALNLVVDADIPNVGGWTYYRVLDNMMECAAWAQTDPSQWARGGWRYSVNPPDSDNSVTQWPVIGLEAAEQWGIVAPAWVKSELRNYWMVRTYNSSYKNWGYGDTSYLTMAHFGTGLSMLAYVGVPKTDPWYTDALNSMASHWSYDSYYTFEGYYWPPWSYYSSSTQNRDNYYAFYGIAKALRIARDAAGKVSAVTQVGTHDWYADYTAHILPRQQTDGSWPATGDGTWVSAINTPFAILVLEPTVASLRPQASIVASPNPVHPLSALGFDISGSTHQDPAKWLASWKLIFNAATVNWSTPDAQGTFPVGAPIPKPGGYPETGANYDVTAMLQVTDNVGETAEASVIVHITSDWVDPIANPGGPYFGRVAAPVTLNGGGSSSPNPGGTIQRYQWDLDGNGSYETDAGPEATLAHTWATPYSGLIGLKVTDSVGRTSTASVYTKIVVSDLRPVSYPLISSRRVSTYVWEYNYKFAIKNQGTGDASNVSAALQNWPSQVTVMDGNVAFGDVVAGAQVTSGDTFTIRIDRRTPVQNADLTWKLTFTDAGGTTWVLLNFPLY